MEKDLSYHGIYPIRAHEIDHKKLLSTPFLVQIMQDASLQNALTLKVSVWDLEDKKISWVLLRKELQVIRFPKLGERIKIITYPAGFDRVFAYRDYKAYDQNGELIAFAGSTWTLMHTEKRTMVRIPSEMFTIDSSSHHELLSQPVNKIPLLSKSEFENQYSVGYYDLDWNGHVNNVFLIRCMMESVPDNYLQNGSLQKLTIHFKTESLWKDQLQVQFERINANTCLHNIMRKNDNKTIAIGMTKWN